MDFNNIKPADAPLLLEELYSPLDTQIGDYLQGRWLGPEGDESKLTYWRGPILPTDHVEYEDMVKALLGAVAADNLLLDVVESALDAVEGLEDWQLSKEGAYQARAKDAQKPTEEQSLVKWADKRQFGSLIYHAALALAGHGRTVGRPLLAARALNEQAQLKPAKDDAAALDNVHWQVQNWPRQQKMVDLTRAGIYTDPDTLEQISILTYTLEGGGQGVELSWLLEDGKTRMKVWEDGKEPHTADLDLQGRLMLIEATLPRPLITRSMLGGMSSYVVASTMLNRNTAYAGFVERWAVGVQPPGNWRTNAQGQRVLGVDGQPIWDNAETSNGPGNHNFYQPEVFTETVRDATGTQTLSERPANAQMGRWEPVDPKSITAALDHWRKAIYREARQMFKEIADDGQTSGVARQTAAGDFVKACEKIRVSLSYFVTELLGLTLSLAAAQRESSQLASYRVTVNSRVEAFKPSPEDRKVNLLEYAAGLLDLELAMTGTGAVKDPDATRGKIEAEAAVKQAQTLGPVDTTTALPKLGDRVKVRAGMEHGPGMGGAGTVEIVNGNLLGVRLDAMPDKVHKWYSADEVEAVSKPMPAMQMGG